MTNGEKIREVFPNARVKNYKATDLVDEHVTVFINGCDTCQDYSMDWWNAEYTEPTIESGISNKSIIYKAKKSKEIQEDLDKLSKLNESTTKSETLVSLDVYKQVAKERDIAIEQLHELGYEFGQKIEPTTKNDLRVDCISRQAVLRLLASSIGKSNTYLQTKVLRMSSVTPIRPKGHWIEEKNDYGEVTGWHCDKCYEDSGFTTTCKWDFCPNCGADMRGNENEID